MTVYLLIQIVEPSQLNTDEVLMTPASSADAAELTYVHTKYDSLEMPF
jgi:hypothetical protein